MATLDELGRALVNADAAGDVAAARALASEITRMRQAAPAQPPAPDAAAPAQAYDAMGMPTGADPAAPVQASMSYGDQMSRIGGVLDKGVRMAANGMTFGLADRFAGGMDALTGRAPSYDAGVRAQRAETEAVRAANPGAAAVAEAAGGLASGAGLVKSGITLAGRVGSGMLPRVLGYGAEGAAYGGVHGAGSTYSDRIADYIENAKKGATTGALIGGALPVAGNAAGALYRTGAAFLGPRVEGASRGASALLRGAAQADEAGLQRIVAGEAHPDTMLVDAGPAMLGLGQGAGTGTGAGRARLVNNLRSRDARTGQRLAEALDTNLGPAPIPSQVEAGLKGARKALSPEYEAAFDGARAVDTPAIIGKIDEMIPNVRGEARTALMKVRDDLHITDAQGLTQVADPHPRALMAVRESLDGALRVETNSNVQRVLGDVRRLVDGELADKVPGIKVVDAKYADLKRQSEALERGQQLLDPGRATVVRPAELVDEMAGMTPSQQARLREGTRAEVDRLVGTNVNDLNTLERKIGTPQDWNSQKLETIFGEGPVANVAKALMDNRRFRQSYQDIVQNSQTAQRQEAAKAMRGSEGGNVPHDVTLTGVGLKALNAVAKAISGASNAKTKDEIGNILAQQGPAVQRVARALLESAQRTGENASAINRVLSSPYWISATAPVVGRKATQ